MDDDTMSVYVFGEEEESLRQAAQENDGCLSYDHLRDHYGQKEIDKVGVALRHLCRSTSFSLAPSHAIV